MDIIILLVIIMPGLMIYSRIRNSEENCQNQIPEYVVLIKGIFYSMPLITIILLAINIYYGKVTIEILESLIIKPKFIVAYFVTIWCYTPCALFSCKQYRLKIRPYLCRKMAKKTNKGSYDSGHYSAWEEVSINYMKSYKNLVGRLIKDGKVIACGQIGLIAEKDVCFFHQDKYSLYFPEGECPKYENICNYVNLETLIVLELYDGMKEI